MSLERQNSLLREKIAAIEKKEVVVAARVAVSSFFCVSLFFSFFFVFLFFFFFFLFLKKPALFSFLRLLVCFEGF
jgi:hypothetical protein